MDKFSQDAADALQGHKDRAAQDWKRHKEASKTITTTWAPTMNDQQKREHEQYVVDNKLPF